jgi:hypothetical protein
VSDRFFPESNTDVINSENTPGEPVNRLQVNSWFTDFLGTSGGSHDVFVIGKDGTISIDLKKDSYVAQAMSASSPDDVIARDSALKIDSLAMSYFNVAGGNPYNSLIDQSLQLQAGRLEYQFEQETRTDLKNPSEGIKVSNYLQAFNSAAITDWGVPLDHRDLPTVYFHFSGPQTVDQICIGFPPYVKSGFPTQTYYGEAVCGQRDNNSSDK